MEADQHIKLIDFSNSLKADWKMNFCSLKQNITKQQEKTYSELSLFISSSG